MSAPEDAPEGGRLSPGLRVASRYTVGEPLGEGTSGIVYLARREGDGGEEPVALKVIHRHLSGNRQIYRRFQREAAILKRIEGDHVVKLLELVEHDGLLVLALEYVDGGSLEALLQRSSPLDADLAVHIALEICAALEAAHEAGVIHRDLKPANVLIERQAPPGSRRAAQAALPGRVRVVDFGLAKVVRGEQMTTSLTEQDMIFGTPEYMAPEQVRGDEELDDRCDIYALGCMLYEMTVGSVPFAKRTAIAVMNAHLTEIPPSPRSSRPGGGLPSGLEAVILRALSKRPEDRYASARTFADALAACVSHAQVITPLGAAAASSAQEISATDLNLTRSALEHSPTFPGDLPPAAPAPPGKDLALAKTLPVEAHPAAPARPAASPVASSAASPTLSSAQVPAAAARAGRARAAPPVEIASPPRSERWLWILVAIVFAALGMILGTLFGAR